MTNLFSDVIVGLIIFLPLMFFPGYVIISRIKFNVLERIGFSFVVSISLLVTLLIVIDLVTLPVSIISLVILGVVTSLSVILYRWYKQKNLRFDKKKGLINFSRKFSEKFQNVVKFFRRNRLELVLYIVPAIFLFAYIGVISFEHPFAVAGDGLIHTIVAREISETNQLVEYQPYRFTVANSGEHRPVPVDYPLSFFVLMAMVWELGGNFFLKTMPVFFAFLTYLFSVLIMRKFTTYWAGLVAALVLFVNLERFLSPVLIETLLLPFALASMYCYMELLTNPNKKSYIILLGLLLGFTIAIKQQGMVLYLFFAIHFFAYKFYYLLRARKKYLLQPAVESKKGNKFLEPLTERSLIPLVGRTIMNFFYGVIYSLRNKSLKTLPNGTFLLVALLVALPATIDLYDRNGTIFGADIELLRYFPLPLHTPLYENDGKAALVERISYWFIYEGIHEPFLNGLAYVLCQCKPETFEKTLLYSLPILAFSVAAFFAAKKKNLTYLTLFAFILFGEILSAYLRNDRIQQYHQIALAIIPFFYLGGIIALLNYLLKINKIKTQIIISCVGAIIIASLFVSAEGFSELHKRYSGPDVGRITHSIMPEYVKLANFMNSTIADDSVVLGYSNAMTFLKQDLLWIHISGGSKVPEIFESQNVFSALKLLKEYNVDYIFIETGQLKRKGLIDYIEKYALYQNLDDFDNFVRIFTSPSGSLELYKIDYCPQTTEKNIILFDGRSARWEKAIANSVAVDFSYVPGTAMIILQGKGVEQQYARYESSLDNLIMNESMFITLDWEEPIHDYIWAEVELYGKEDSHKINLNEYNETRVTLNLPLDSTFDTISLKVSLEKNLTAKGFFLFNEILIESTEGMCV